MLRLYFKWRYRRAQRASLFSLPKSSSSQDRSRVNFSSYLAQHSVRGRSDLRYERVQFRRKVLKWTFILGLLIGCTWVIVESARAISTF